MLPAEKERAHELYNEKSSMAFVVREPGTESVFFPCSMMETTALIDRERTTYEFFHVSGTPSDSGAFLSRKLLVNRRGSSVSISVSEGYARGADGSGFAQQKGNTITVPVDDYNYLLEKVKKNIDVTTMYFAFVRGTFTDGVGALLEMKRAGRKDTASSLPRAAQPVTEQAPVPAQPAPAARGQRQAPPVPVTEQPDAGRPEHAAPARKEPAAIRWDLPDAAKKPNDIKKNVRFTPVGQFCENEDGTWTVTLLFGAGGKPFPVLVKNIPEELEAARDGGAEMIGNIILGSDKKFYLG